MNERMIELYKEASDFAYKICKDEGRAGGPTDHIWNTLSTGRFAELIVQECAEVIDEKISPPSHPMNSIGYKLKEHFGVK